MRLDSSDVDDCKDIQIVVPELLSPSSPTFILTADEPLFSQTKEGEPARAPMSIEQTTGTQFSSALLVPMTDCASLMVGESPSGFKAGIPEMTSTPIEPCKEEQMHVTPQDTTAESELNTNNNSATCEGAPPREIALKSAPTLESQIVEDNPPVEGTVKLRVNSIENQQVVPDVEDVEECTNTADNAVLDVDMQVSSGTVQKQKQDIEERLKAKAAEKGSPPLTRSGKASPEPTLPTKDSTTTDGGDPVNTDQPKLAESQDSVKPETDASKLSSPLPAASCLLQEMSTASPTLQALEIGRIKKITEQLLSQKSPTKDLDESEKQSPSADKRKSWNFECGSPPPDYQTKFVLLQKSSPIASRRSLVLEATEAMIQSSDAARDNIKVDEGASQAQPMSSEESTSDESPRKEPFIRTFFGEEISLEPGIVKRQADGFEQLSSQEQLELITKEADLKKVQQENSLLDEGDMVVIIREKRKSAEDKIQNKHFKVEQSGDVAETEVEEESGNDKGIVNSAYPEEGSSWKVGDVRRHTQQFEGMSVPIEDTG